MINILSRETIEKIAAGEVAEKPSSVVKELIDNAVDSGADSISIEIRGGGLELIRVTDNGCGIEKDDIRNAFLPHATSKIKDAADLAHVITMGFRGEALSSIAAVSDVELITKTAGSLTGADYRIKEGKELSFKEIGAPGGTTIIIRDFLFNIPVRKGFLKSQQLENSYISAVVYNAMLAYPGISFQLALEGRSRTATSGNGSLKDVIYILFGAEAAGRVVKLDAQKDGIRVGGYIGRPELSKSRRDHEHFIINGRPSGSDILRKALEDSFAPYLMQHRFPFAVVVLNLDPVLTDVNVHPQKLEVRFQNPAAVYDVLSDAVSAALKSRELIPEAAKPFTIKDEGTLYGSGTESGKKNANEAPKSAPRTEPYESNRKFDYVNSIENIIQSDERYRNRDPYEGGQERNSPGSFANKKNAPYFRLVGQVFKTYWIVELEDSMYLIDQHAAHEKVNYEKYVSLIEAHKASGQFIYPPIVLTLDPREAVLLSANLELFAELGYEIDHAGGNDYIVRAVPANLPEIGDEHLLKDLLGSIFEEGKKLNSQMLKDRIATMSCKAAVKGNTCLSEPEMKALLEELLTLQNPYFCPHGRPVIVKWTRYELDRLFKRIV